MFFWIESSIFTSISFSVSADLDYGVVENGGVGDVCLIIDDVGVEIVRIVVVAVLLLFGLWSCAERLCELM